MLQGTQTKRGSEPTSPLSGHVCVVTDSYLGSIMSLCLEHRAVQQNSKNIDNRRVMLQYLMPLSEIVVDFYNQLKSVSSGYASFDYEECGYASSKLIKVIPMLIINS